MIQVWKGTYFYVTNGAEIGIYNRVPGEEMGTFYNCANDEQMMEMQMKLSYGDKVLINTKPQVHWWLTGFHLSGVVYEPASLTMEYSIKFPNATMMKAFTDSNAILETSECITEEECKEKLLQACEEGYEYIVGAEPAIADMIAEVASEYPDTEFAIYDAEVTLSFFRIIPAPCITLQNLNFRLYTFCTFFKSCEIYLYNR